MSGMNSPSVPFVIVDISLIKERIKAFLKGWTLIVGDLTINDEKRLLHSENLFRSIDME
jgi:hypothetical protein